MTLAEMDAAVAAGGYTPDVARAFAQQMGAMRMASGNYSTAPTATNLAPPTNPNQYKKWFKQQTGMTPQEYAEAIGGVYYTGSMDKYWDNPSLNAYTRAGAGANVITPGYDIRQMFGSTGSRSPEAAASIVRAQTGYDLPTLELARQFGGREQWVRNLEGRGGDALPPWLRNVSMVGFSDPDTLALLMGNLGTYSARGATDDWIRNQQELQKLVPAWAPEVAKDLKAQGLPYFPIELLASPELNLTDPSKPLFDAGEAPTSLFQLGVLQGGENAFYRGLSAEELMRYIAPLYWQQYHRAAGSPAPYETGLTFGSPVQRPGPSGNYTDAVFEKSPVMGATGGPQYINPAAMQAAGFTPQQLAAAQGEDQLQLLRSLGGGYYNRWTGWQYPGMDQGIAQMPPAAGTMGKPLGDLQGLKSMLKVEKDPVKKQQIQAAISKLEEELMRYYWWEQNWLYGPYGDLPNTDPDAWSRYQTLWGDPSWPNSAGT